MTLRLQRENDSFKLTRISLKPCAKLFNLSKNGTRITTKSNAVSLAGSDNNFRHSYKCLNQGLQLEEPINIHQSIKAKANVSFQCCDQIQKRSHRKRTRVTACISRESATIDLKFRDLDLAQLKVYLPSKKKNERSQNFSTINTAQGANKDGSSPINLSAAVSNQESDIS